MKISQSSMNFQILINNKDFLHGTVPAFILVAFISIIILIGIILEIWHRLHENEKLKYEFITIIAHKFRTPLTHLKWLSEELIEAETDSTKREHLSDLNNSTDKLIGLTGSLIEITNEKADTSLTYHFEKIDLCKLVKEIADSCKSLFGEKNIMFSVQHEPGEIMVRVDRERFGYVLRTILENSYTYTPSGRTVMVKISKSLRKAIVSVSDNGIGIEHGDTAKIFTKFYRAKNAREVDTEGFGIGLFLARTIMQRHKGKIEFYSPGRDKGATFQMILPKM